MATEESKRIMHNLVEARELCYAPRNSAKGADGIVDDMKVRNHIETSKDSRDVKRFCAIFT